MTSVTASVTASERGLTLSTRLATTFGWGTAAGMAASGACGGTGAGAGSADAHAGPPPSKLFKMSFTGASANRGESSNPSSSSPRRTWGCCQHWSKGLSEGGTWRSGVLRLGPASSCTRFLPRESKLSSLSIWRTVLRFPWSCADAGLSIGTGGCCLCLDGGRLLGS